MEVNDIVCVRTNDGSFRSGVILDIKENVYWGKYTDNKNPYKLLFRLPKDRVFKVKAIKNE